MSQERTMREPIRTMQCDTPFCASEVVDFDVDRVEFVCREHASIASPFCPYIWRRLEQDSSQFCA
jgi:hypothetical protein